MRKWKEHSASLHLQKCKEKIYTAIIILLISSGICMLLYPTVSNWWNQVHQSEAIAGYAKIVDSMSDESYAQMLKNAQEYNTWLLTNNYRFFPTEEETTWYESLLDITGTGIMAYIEIPSIDVELSVYHGTKDAVLQIAAGHMEGSSLPIGGSSTHSVISGHCGLASAKLFTDLSKLTVGDEFYIHVLNEVHRYVVDEINVVLPDDLSKIEIVDGEDYCTLLTCTPYGVNSHRLLVRGVRAD